MKWIVPAFAAVLLALLCLSIPSPVFITKASASRMDGKPTCGQMNCMQDRYYAAQRRAAKLKKPK